MADTDDAVPATVNLPKGRQRWRYSFGVTTEWSTMTTTESITESPPTDRPCPSWCAGCTPTSEGGYGHSGDESTISLSLVAPMKFHDIMQDLDSWCPAEVSVYAEQKHGAIFPVIKVTRGDLLEDVLLTLTLNEAGELGALLTVMMSKARDVYASRSWLSRHASRPRQ